MDAPSASLALNPDPTSISTHDRTDTLTSILRPNSTTKSIISPATSSRPLPVPPTQPRPFPLPLPASDAGASDNATYYLLGFLGAFIAALGAYAWWRGRVAAVQRRHRRARVTFRLGEGRRALGIEQRRPAWFDVWVRGGWEKGEADGEGRWEDVMPLALTTELLKSNTRRLSSARRPALVPILTNASTVPSPTNTVSAPARPASPSASIHTVNTVDTMQTMDTAYTAHTNQTVHTYNTANSSTTAVSVSTSNTPRAVAAQRRSTSPPPQPAVATIVPRRQRRSLLARLPRALGLRRRVDDTDDGDGSTPGIADAELALALATDAEHARANAKAKAVDIELQVVEPVPEPEPPVFAARIVAVVRMPTRRRRGSGVGREDDIGRAEARGVGVYELGVACVPLHGWDLVKQRLKVV
ncbi:hypothetical protein H0H81_010448 [Sphagnurus paluster]|uniref:Uncharacterized protein n=1 Tax=Sphagnurus paluster TaxID=117069 RepID=A0A9P7K5B3_9AGAR|nr:hypothetical protein H0H81_010448 [Sphagnurus paluster]